MEDLIAALLLERYGPPPTHERRAPARPRVPWTPDTPWEIKRRRETLARALGDIPIKHGRRSAA